MIGEPEGFREKREEESYIEYFLSESKFSEDLESSSLRSYETAWNSLTSWLDNNNIEVNDLSKSVVKDYCHYLEKKDVSDEIARRYIRSNSRTISWLIDAGQADYNPFTHYENYFTPTEGTTEKIEITISELRKGIQDAKSQRIEFFVYLVLILKLGIRRMEALNLDLRDIQLDHPISKKMPKPRKEVFNHSDSIHIDSSINKGQMYNGEVREYGNKPKSTRTLPIDQETKQLLVWFIAMHQPTTSPAKPLFRKLTDPEGRRWTKGNMGNHLYRWAVDHGWNSEDMKYFGVSSHWCRHWFTTHLRANIDDDEVAIGNAKEYVQGLRGDSGSGVIETYTQEWESVKDDDSKPYRTVYEDNIPMLFVDPDNG